jgi:CheY-like chemotaxis protein
MGVPAQQFGEDPALPLTAELAPTRRRDFVGVQPALEGKRLLVVDDNATNRRVLALQTAKWGMQVRATESPHEALRWVEQGDPFDLAILDMHMPEMDGLELARRIRKTKAGLPLVLFSSLGRREAGKGGARSDLVRGGNRIAAVDAAVWDWSASGAGGSGDSRGCRPGGCGW